MSCLLPAQGEQHSPLGRSLGLYVVKMCQCKSAHATLFCKVSTYVWVRQQSPSVTAIDISSIHGEPAFFNEYPSRNACLFSSF